LVVLDVHDFYQRYEAIFVTKYCPITVPLVKVASGPRKELGRLRELTFLVPTRILEIIIPTIRLADLMRVVEEVDEGELVIKPIIATPAASIERIVLALIDHGRSRDIFVPRLVRSLENLFRVMV